MTEQSPRAVGDHERVAGYLALAHGERWIELDDERKNQMIVAAHEALMSLVPVDSPRIDADMPALLLRIEAFAVLRYTPLQFLVPVPMRRRAAQIEAEKAAADEAEALAAAEAAAHEETEQERIAREAEEEEAERAAAELAATIAAESPEDAEMRAWMEAASEGPRYDQESQTEPETDEATLDLRQSEADSQFQEFMWQVWELVRDQHQALSSKDEQIAALTLDNERLTALVQKSVTNIT